MSQSGHGPPDEVSPVATRQQAGWPTTPPPHRPLGSGDPAEVGSYPLEAVLGEGGMGRVFLGRTPAGSPVAVKVVHREYAADPAFRKRFEQEVMAARRVQGLYTAPVIDADVKADEPWLATAYFSGPSLQYAVTEHGPLSVEVTLDLVAKVAEALQSIHAADVVHRDLKPSNVILTADGPKVIDFGIARAADVTSITGTGSQPGTPAYMAPEYIDGKTLTPAADIFALGVLANFVASGELAFGGGPALIVIRRIVELEPDLDGCPEPVRAIATACLAKDPGQRPTPGEVIRQCRQATTAGSIDSDAHVSAPPTRQRTAPTAVPVPGSGTRPATATKRKTGPADAPAPSPVVSDLNSAPDSYPTGHTWRPERAAAGIITAAGLALALGVWLNIPSSTLSASPSTAASPRTTPSFPPIATLTGHSSLVDSVAFSPDGKTLATGSYDETVKLWDVDSHKRRATLNHPATVYSVAFSPDGKTLATGGYDKTVKLWDVDSRNRRATFTAGRQDLWSLAFNPDGQTLAIPQPASVGLWDVAGRRRRATLAGPDPVSGVAFSPDGQILATATQKGRVELWDVAGRIRRATLGGGHLVAFSPDGKTLAVASNGSNGDRTVRLWDVASGEKRATLPDATHTGDSQEVSAVAFSPNGRLLATSYNGDRTVRLWDVTTGTQRATFTGHSGEVYDVAFSPNGQLLASASEDETANLWKVPS